MVTIRAYSWPDVVELTRTLAAQLAAIAPPPDVIVCVLRGGSFVGLLLSHLLDVREMYALRAETTLNESARADRLEVVKVAPIDGFPALAGRRVLLVDDVVNTGATLGAAREALERGGCREILTAALLWDTVDVDPDVPPADVVVETVHAWVAFPWEREKLPTVRES